MTFGYFWSLKSNNKTLKMPNSQSNDCSGMTLFIFFGMTLYDSCHPKADAIRELGVCEFLLKQLQYGIIGLCGKSQGINCQRVAGLQSEIISAFFIHIR